MLDKPLHEQLRNTADSLLKLSERVLYKTGDVNLHLDIEHKANLVMAIAEKIEQMEALQEVRFA